MTAYQTKNATSKRAVLAAFKATIRSEVNALNSATIANRAAALERATAAFREGARRKSEIHTTCKGVTIGDCGRMWHELNLLEDAIVLAGGVPVNLHEPKPVC